MTKRMSAFLGLVTAMLVGIVVGLYAQSNSDARLAKLSEEKAEISKMDLVLLNTRVAVLQQILSDDSALPFVPTSIIYDTDKKKIRVSVHVDPAFLAKTNANQLGGVLEARAAGLCIAPEMAEGNFVSMLPIQPPIQYCVIRFFTEAPGSDGRSAPKNIASFEDGKLAME